MSSDAAAPATSARKTRHSHPGVKAGRTVVHLRRDEYPRVFPRKNFMRAARGVLRSAALAADLTPMRMSPAAMAELRRAVEVHLLPEIASQAADLMHVYDRKRLSAQTLRLAVAHYAGVDLGLQGELVKAVHSEGPIAPVAFDRGSLALRSSRAKKATPPPPQAAVPAATTAAPPSLLSRLTRAINGAASRSVSFDD